jgi:hypothetical protein
VSSWQSSIIVGFQKVVEHPSAKLPFKPSQARSDIHEYGFGGIRLYVCVNLRAPYSGNILADFMGCEIYKQRSLH